LPRAGSEGDKALRAASPGSFWDAIAMLADKDRSRLAAYAAGDRDLPVPGFWTEEEIDRWL
jgi:hypothetical protein